MKNLDWAEIKNFIPQEFDCKCGCGQGANMMQPGFVAQLDLAREYAGIPFAITSGYRCPEHNAGVGGVSSSSHTRGYAADIACLWPRNRAKIIQAAIRAGFTRVGIAKKFIHLDCDPDKPPDVFWVY